MANCSDYISADDLKTGKQAILHIEHVAKSKDANGNPADIVTDEIRGESVTNPTLEGFFSSIGFKPVDGSFETGGTINHRWETLLYQTDGQYYQWMGALPKVVPSGSTPATTGGVDATHWVNQSDLTLRADLASSTGYRLVPSIYKTISGVPVEQYRDGIRTDQQIIQAANDYATSVGRKVIFEVGVTYNVTTLNCTCEWTGPAIIKRANGTGSTLITLASGGYLDSLIIDGNADNAVGNPSAIVGANRFKVIKCKIFNNPGHSLAVVNTPAGNDRSLIKSNIIYGSGSGASSAGSAVYFYNGARVDVIGNDLYGKNGGILGQGNIRVIADIKVSRNTVHNNLSTGISFNLMTESADQQAYEKISITKNSVYNNGGTGIAAQSDLTIVDHNHIWGNGSQTYHQGVLVNANGVIVSNNVITDNAGVGIDFGDCRKCSATTNHIEENGWLGIELNSSEQMTVTGNILNLNFKGKSGADLQAAILVHKGSGGYPFLGDSKDITITGNAIRSGDGQQYAILIADTNCYNITVTGNTCKLAGLLDDIVSRSNDVMIENNNTRWDPLGSARATLSSGVVSIPSVANVVQINGTGSVVTINISDNGAYIKDRTVRIRSVNGCVIENSGGSGGNIFIGSSVTLSAGQSILLYSDGSGGWLKA